MHYPLELHIVNQPANTTSLAGLVPGAVIAVLFQYTPDNTASSFLAPLLANAPTGLAFSNYVTAATANQYAAKNNSVETVVTSSPMNLAALVASADPTTYYRYTGSLTTPGCSQTVLFNVLAQPLPVSIQQVQQFTTLLAAAQGGISRGADNRAINPTLTSTTVMMSQPEIAFESAAPKAAVSAALLAVAAAALAF